nr:uncharacterized protein LOC109766933 isoform X2 [Aegilops tauschii subsp. strangulata]
MACSSVHWGRGGAPSRAVVVVEPGLRGRCAIGSVAPDLAAGQHARGRSGGAALLPVATDVGVPKLPPVKAPGPRLVTHGAFLWIHTPLLSSHFRLVTHIIHAAQDLVRKAGIACEELGRAGERRG